jgi:shikimate kinase
MMAVGKTTVGGLCASELRWPFLDSDAQLLADTGRSAQDIFDVDGDEALRTWEGRVLIEAIAHPVPVVVAVAGGVVLDASNRELLMRSGVVVWLRASIATLSGRVERGGARPRLGADPTRSLEDLSAARYALYASVAQFVVDVDDLAPADVVARILDDTGLGSVGR